MKEKKFRSYHKIARRSEYTGVLDKNNKKIFKGDIVSYNQSNCSDEDMKLFKLKPAKGEIRYCPKNECFFVMGWLGVSLKDMRSLKVVPCKKL